MAYLEQVAFADLCDEMQTASNELVLQEAMSRFVRRNGFEWFAYIAKTPNEGYGNSTYPAGWQSLYVERSFYETDPVLLAAAKDALPFTWETRKFVSRKADRKFFALANDFNVREGLTVPIAGVYGSFAALSLAGPHNDNTLPAYQENLSLLTLASLHYHLQTNRVRELTIRAENPGRGLLTPRSRSCLIWIARGKTIEEAADILGIHEATVRYHLNDARRRLNAMSLPHLVAEALSKGEIVY